jgi:hypothetical protein
MFFLYPNFSDQQRVLKTKIALSKYRSKFGKFIDFDENMILLNLLLQLCEILSAKKRVFGDEVRKFQERPAIDDIWGIQARNFFSRTQATSVP